MVIEGLASEAERIARVRSERAGVTHRRALSPRAPRVGEPVVIELTAGPECPAGETWLEVDGRRHSLQLVGTE